MIKTLLVLILFLLGMCLGEKIQERADDNLVKAAFLVGYHIGQQNTPEEVAATTNL